MFYWGIWLFRPARRTCRLGWGSWGSGGSVAQPQSHTWRKSTEKWPFPPSLPENSWLFTAESTVLISEVGGKGNRGRFLEPCFGLSPLFSPCENPEGVTGQTVAQQQELGIPGWNFAFSPVQLFRTLREPSPRLVSPWAASNSHCWEPQTCWGLGGSCWSSHGLCRTLEQVLEALESLGHPWCFHIKNFFFCLSSSG